MANIPRVLVVDDSPTSSLLMARALQKVGYQVSTATDGREGWMRALLQRPHCIIIDVVLPDISGFALCRQLRAIDPQRSLSIILVSTKNTRLDRLWGLRQGANYYLPKPFSEEILIQTVKEALDKGS